MKIINQSVITPVVTFSFYLFHDNRPIVVYCFPYYSLILSSFHKFTVENY